MRVQCCLCEYEKDGFCLKKVKRGSPLKIKTGKRRSCGLYSEDPMRVFSRFRAREVHEAGLKRQELRRAQLVKAMENAKRGSFTLNSSGKGK